MQNDFRACIDCSSTLGSRLGFGIHIGGNAMKIEDVSKTVQKRAGTIQTVLEGLLASMERNPVLFCGSDAEFLKELAATLRGVANMVSPASQKPRIGFTQ